MVDPEGRLVELGADGVALLVDPVELSLWRAAIDNDGLKLLGGGIPRLDGRRLPRWLALGIDRLEVGRVRVERPRRGRWIVERELRGAHPSCVVTHFQRIDIDSTGITFTETVRLPTELDDLPRVGTTFSVGAAFDRVRWFGRGPHECYPDRQSSAMAAVWDGGIDRLPYLVPQEFGLRTDCRWFALEAPGWASGSVCRASTACSTAPPPTIATPTSTPPPTRPSSRPARRSSSTPMPATAASARPAAVRTPCGSTGSARAPGAGAGGCRPTGCRLAVRS